MTPGLSIVLAQIAMAVGSTRDLPDDTPGKREILDHLRAAIRVAEGGKT